MKTTLTSLVTLLTLSACGPEAHPGVRVDLPDGGDAGAVCRCGADCRPSFACEQHDAASDAGQEDVADSGPSLDAGAHPDAFEQCGACPGWFCPTGYRCDRPAGICYTECTDTSQCYAGTTCEPLGRDGLRVCTRPEGRIDASVGQCPGW